MFYNVRLIDDSGDTSTAEVLWTPENKIRVNSKNSWMKRHIESIISQPGYILSPNQSSEKDFTDGFVELKPDTLQFFYGLQDLLSWRGYVSEFSAEEHPATLVAEVSLAKSMGNSYIHTNDDGERIVERVPEGYVAISNDGHTIAAGGFLNANIDKEGAKWRLIKNEYAETDPEERETISKQHMGKPSHTPGMFNKLYEKGEMKLPKPIADGYMSQGKTLQEHFSGGENASDATVKPDENKPKSTLKPGNIIYSPQLGIAMDTKHWSQEDYAGKKADWYIFSHPIEVDTMTKGNNDLRVKMLKNLLGATKSPMYIGGVEKGPVPAPKDLDVSKGYKFVPKEFKPETSDGKEDGIIVNNPDYRRFEASQFDSPEYLQQVEASTQNVKRIRLRMHQRDDRGRDFVDPTYEKEEIKDLNGEHAKFYGELRFYQKPLVETLTDLTQYEFYGGAPGVHGVFLNVFQGAGKTPTVIAAEGVLRNRGIIKEGTQTSFAIVPSKTTHSMANKIYKFRKKPCTVIDGIEPGKTTPTKEYRIKQWEHLVKQAQEGKLPHMVVIGVSKIREENGPDDEDTSSIDLKFMKLLNSGGSYKNASVTGGHVGLAILDESAHYLNPGAARTKLMHDFVERLYAQKGLVWTLNGDITSNSATDIIMEMSLVNKGARDNIVALENFFTKQDPARPLSEQRIWTTGGLYQFMRRFGSQITSLSGEAAARDTYGMEKMDDISLGLGKEWLSMYQEAVNALNVIYDPTAAGKDKRILGMLNVLTNISYGVLNPVRALEYGIGTQPIFGRVAELLDSNNKKLFYTQMSEFVANATEMKNGRRVPKLGIPSTKRDAMYESIIDEKFRHRIDMEISKWSNPVLDTIVDDMFNYVNQSGTKAAKHGIAGVSKRAIQALHAKLKLKFAGKGVDIYKFDGDTDSKTMAKQEEEHANKRKSSIVLVTAAAGYSLSLSCDGVSYRFPCWNPAKGNQLEKRFHRNPEDSATIGVVVPTGICAYMRDVENSKRRLMTETASGAISDTDDSSDDEFDDLSSEGLQKLIEKINSRMYSPRLEKEAV